MYDTGIAPQCFACARLEPIRPGSGWCCSAFPSGIPKPILINSVDHEKPYNGDSGLQFVPREGVERLDDIFVPPKSAVASPKPAKSSKPAVIKPPESPAAVKPPKPAAKPKEPKAKSIEFPDVGEHVSNVVHAVAAAGPRPGRDDEANGEPVCAAGVMFITPSKEILLCRRVDNGYWSIPGGRLESEETPIQAAAREAKEETGREVKTEELAEWTRATTANVDFVTFLCPVSEMFEPKLNDEHSAHRWAPLVEL